MATFARTLAAGAFLACAGAVCATAQQLPAPPAAAFSSIVRQPAQQSSFTLDRSMLAATDGFFGGQDPEGRRIAAGLNSITFHNFHYKDTATYDYAAFSSLNAGYEGAGFRHLVNASGQGKSTTDLWLRFTGANITDVVVLNRGDRNMNAIHVSCNLRPLDLLHLSGHFGIPQMDSSAVMVPAAPGTVYAQPPNGAAGAQGGYPPPPPPNGTYSNPANGTYSGSTANGSYSTPPPPSPAAPMQNPPTLHQHSADDPQ